MQLATMTQEEAADVLEGFKSSTHVADIGCAIITIGEHPELGSVITIIGDNERAALIRVS